MVFHVGAHFEDEKIILYNTESKSVYTLNIREDPRIKKSNVPNNVENQDKVEVMFNKIKSSIIGELGCICVFSETCDNEERKKIIEVGETFGFQSVGIINRLTAACINGIKESGYSQKNDDIIWIADGNTLAVWKVINGIAHFVTNALLNKDGFEYNYSVSSSTLCCDPDIIISDRENYAEKILRTKTTDKTVLSFTISKYSLSWPPESLLTAALLKSRIMAGDIESMKYDVSNTTTEKTTLHHNDAKVAFSEHRNLPLNQIIVGKHEGNKNTIEIKIEKERRGENKKQFLNIFNGKMFCLNLHIDNNEIYSFTPTSAMVVTISNDWVASYSTISNSSLIFRAAIDYKTNPVVHDAAYESPSVIKSPLLYFGKKPENDMPQHMKYCYSVFTSKNEEKLIGIDQFIADLFKEAKRRMHELHDKYLVTIPLYFAHTEMYQKLFEKLEGKNIQLIDEYFALANGLKHRFDLSTPFYYIIAHYSAPFLIISLFHGGQGFCREFERHKFHDDILDSIDHSFDADNKTSEKLKGKDEDVHPCFELLQTLVTTYHHHDGRIKSIFVTREKQYYTAIYYHFLQNFRLYIPIDILFIEVPEEFIAKGAVMSFE